MHERGSFGRQVYDCPRIVGARSAGHPTKHRAKDDRCGCDDDPKPARSILTRVAPEMDHPERAAYYAPTPTLKASRPAGMVSW